MSADIQQVQATDLYDGPRSKKVAKYTTIKNRHTGEVHHHSLTLETIRKLRDGDVIDEKKSITLDDEHADQIGALAAFIQGVRGADAEAAPWAHLLAQLERVGSDLEGLRAIVAAAKARPDAFAAAAAAIDFGRYAAGYKRFGELVEADAPAADMRAHLRAHPWLFGCAFSPLQGARELVPDTPHDFDFRRTVEGALEIAVIKAPLGGKPLFVVAEAEQAEHPRAELAAALGLAMGYLDAAAEAHVDRPRALLVIGRDGDEAQQRALRQLNAHLRDVEVVTYDHLRRIGGRVLEALRAAAHRGA